ncbi:Histone acetyltransferase SAGA, TRRAP/TRA1 component, PI-3 kinase superfamily [Phaffia rhodozyma]|uniref:Histone acetyltransferase SAGA, TRRAP/TRA1 component, PI-3 kinase superfamily n=1 Tax=Phaffia rhodozyma TaxID=264483 RepID=A0A0F7SLU9_PHARH|nr:Histone acetyltransferase SAGA, TRRAP/TRA1 component, PI-3 kinase superfamily [Phaffia rhodozyma]
METERFSLLSHGLTASPKRLHMSNPSPQPLASSQPPSNTNQPRRIPASASSTPTNPDEPPSTGSTANGGSKPASGLVAELRRPVGQSSTISAAPTAGSNASAQAGIVSVADCETFAARLMDPGSDVKTKLAIATELRESVEQFRDVDYARYLDILLPAFTEVLRNGTPVFGKEMGEHKLRHTLLEIIQRLPHNEYMRPFADSLMSLMLHLLRVENEDNGVICIKIMIDHNRTFKDEVEKHVKEFLDLVKVMYGNLRAVVKEEFGVEGELAASPTNPDDPTKTLRPSLRSFKVLTECPIAVVLVFQTWRQIVFPYIKDYFPLVMECLTLQAEPQRRAYLASAEKGEIFVGVAEGITNRELYQEFIVAQVKTMSFLAYVLRTATEDIRKHAETMAGASIRLLRDCPPEAVASRKELLVATRHILSTDFRAMFVSQIDVMLDERVLVGTGITSQEALRPLAYSMLADLVHHVRNELTAAQLSRIVHIYSCCLHEPAFTFGIQTMCAKLLLNLIETICSKTDKAEAPKFLLAILESCIDKLAAIDVIHAQLKTVYGKEAVEKRKEMGRSKEEDLPKWLVVERAKPVHAVSYAVDGSEAYSRDLYFLVDARYLMKTLLHGVRALLNQLRIIGAPAPNGTLLGKFFESECRLLAYYDPLKDAREEKEALDLFVQILLHFDPHVFAEVWITKMDFFVNQALANGHLLTIPQYLLVPTNSQVPHLQDVSHQLVAIILKYLMGQLEAFGEQDKKRGPLTLKLFKLAFLAVNSFPEHNESILVPYLAKLITNSFSYAAKATEPTIYYTILRALFRSIGGGRFEALYKEVLPILQEMLDTLNYLLLHAEPDKRDLFVELCLTVPVRLTNLLPHLGYLMKPLVHALRAGPELVSQGLRTLELCIDNLTSEFLDPTLGPVLRDLMGALHDLLRPVPFNHHHSHATVKILGKLGGRNRRFQQVPHLLESNFPSPAATMPINFDGHQRKFGVAVLSELALKSIQDPNEFYRAQAFEFFKQSALVSVAQGVRGSEQEQTFHQCVQGLFFAYQHPELKESALAFLRKLSRHLLNSETRREPPTENHRHGRERHPAASTLVSCYLEGVAVALAGLPSDKAEEGKEIISLVVDDIISQSDDPPSEDAMEDRIDPAPILDALGWKLSSLCFEEPWNRKLAGCTGLSVLTSKPGVGIQWIVDRQLDFLRPLLFILKDMPNDPPRSVSFVVDTIKHILRTCNVDATTGSSQRAKLIQLLIKELASTNSVVRVTSQSCIELLSELTSTTVHDLLLPVKSQLLNPIFDKPLRALPFAMQIGNIEAITYCLNLRPSLPEVNEELVRLLHEAIALADAEDQALIGRQAQHRHEVSLKNLRISCLKLLSAAMACTEFFAKQNHVRSRVIAVYFKHVYSPTKEIMSVAHEGLKHVLAHQNKLPKEVLQSGLRPILVNLADAKRLSVSGLEGLARFLELLTNYFKVEIGHKLLEHFRTLSEEPNMLQSAAFSPLEDNQDIARMVRLINVFRLLPPTANMFLKTLTNLVVEAETNLHQSSPGPFTENLAKYLDRYKTDAVPFLFENLRNPDVIRTFRNVIASGHAPNFISELSAEAKKLGEVCFLDDAAPDLITPGLLLVRELIASDPRWLVTRSSILDSLLKLWRASPQRLSPASGGTAPSASQREPLLIVEMFISYLTFQQHVPLLFDVIRIYTMNTNADLSRVTAFLYENVAVGSTTAVKREVLNHFLGVFGDPNVSWDFKMHCLRLLVNPILVVFFSDKDHGNDLIDAQFAASAHALIWQKTVSDDKLIAAGGDALKIELLQMSTLLVRHCSEVISEVRKDVIKMGWLYIRDADPTVKHTAYLLIARFIESNDCPMKIVMQVWSGLLKLSPSEGRALVRQAIDIIAPVLPQRVQRAANAVHPPWAGVVRKILIEEGHSTPQLLSIFELIVGHPDLFYESRELFVPQMVNSLTRLGSAPAATPEMKKLSIDIVDLVLTWERRRTGTGPSKEDTETNKRASEGEIPSPKRSRVDRAGTAVSSGSSGGWAPPPPLREAIVSYLVRFVSMSPELMAANGLCKRSFELLKELLGPTPWSPVSVKLGFFQRTLVTLELTEQTLAVISNSARVLSLVASNKPDQFFVSQIGVLHKLIEKSVTSDELVLHDSMRPILERMFEVIPLPAEDVKLETDMQTFQDWAENSIAEGLKNGTSLKGTLFILQCWTVTRPDKIEHVFAPHLIKVLTKLCKDHVSPPPPPPTTTSSATPAALAEANVDHIIIVLNLCRPRVTELKDHRRWLLSGLVQLIEKSSSTRLCQYLLEIMRDWVLDPKEALPTHKEKAGLLLKMMAFEKRDDPALLGKFLQLVLDIYSEPSLKRTDLTTRLEPAFLLGTRNADPVLRSKFIDLFDQNLPSTLAGRLQYVLASQSWEALAGGYWIHQALDLLLGCVNSDEALIPGFVSNENSSLLQSLMAQATVGSYLLPARRLLHRDAEISHQVWVSVFKICWSTLSKSQQSDATRHLVALLAKEHHLNQVDMRPNVVQTILEGVLACSPAIVLPPFVVKYLGKTFDAWHTAIELMNNSLTLEPVRSDDGLRESTRDGLAELFADLCEDDMFYGLWRRRSIYAETNAALSYEQNGMWPVAQVFYEAAQIKARTGVLPFTEQEYCLWEDHWITSAQKLQQWDILSDLARAENNHDLLLECAWRLSDWGSFDRDTIESTLAAVSDVATPRRKVFEAYTCLIKTQNSTEKNGDFVKILDEAFQLSIRKWISLPKAITMAHVPLLQLFQQFVELQEASLVFESLAMTNAQNLEFRVGHDLKGIFTTWRERLPNFWDDISVWSDLLAWRQHVFSAVTKVYVPLIPQGETSTFGYRGYHETAWMINRFGHVARKHQLHEVCSNALNKIYALPNIEISEAFLKLREQAMCHYQKPDRLAEGLESISTTNLMYFAPAQKAEFLTLKGMFIAKLGHSEDANHAFAQAVQMDLNLPKAWAEWGRFNDRIFKEKPHDSNLAANAVSCYLQAAGLYKSRKTRKLLVRVLWLLSLDDSSTSAISKAFESYKGDMPAWYWITLVPQLLLSLSHREARHARAILMKIAKTYPQALFYQLRTSKEDFGAIKRQHISQLAKMASRQSTEALTPATNPTPTSVPTPTANGDGNTDSTTPAVKTESTTDSPRTTDTSASTPATNGTTAPTVAVTAPASSSTTESANGAPPAAPPPVNALPAPAPPLPPNNGVAQPRQPWELVEEILNILKTAFPLLALSMEKMVDQIQTRGKPPAEEDIYRFITALLLDGVAQYIQRSDKPGDDGKLSAATKESVLRFAQSVSNLSSSLKASLEGDLIQESALRDYVRKLQKLRDKYEVSLDRRPRKQPLDQANCYLAEFHHGKFDEVEVPGQYLQHVDNNNDFAKIARFVPLVELGRGHGFCFRRITMIGHNGTTHSFSVQLPAARHTRREDRMSQVFRTLSTVLQSRKESRKRNLSFHLPAAIPLAPALRLIELDSSYSSFQDIYDAHCRDKGWSKEDPVLHFTDRFRELFDPANQVVGSPEYVNLRLELMDEIETKFIPKNVLSDYMIRLMKTPSDLFLMRKQFTLQIASVTFITFVAALQQRTLPRFQISRTTGMIYMSELLPFSIKPESSPLLQNDDPVDFRLTPNIQHFITLTGIEGILTASLVAIGRGLCQPEVRLLFPVCSRRTMLCCNPFADLAPVFCATQQFDLEEQLSLFMKDEVYHMINVLKRRPLDDLSFRQLVAQNVEVFGNKVKMISCQYEREKTKGDVPVTQSSTKLFFSAVPIVKQTTKMARSGFIAPHIGRYSRSEVASKRGLYKGPKKVTPSASEEKPAHVEKKIGGGKNGETRLVPTSKASKYYPSEDVKVAKKSRKSPKPTALRSSITPGTVLILLAGRYRGKRVVFLKQLDSGLLLVTGPRLINGVPLRRVAQSYTIATSTKVDISGVKVSENVNDAYFVKAKAAKSADKEGEFFQEKKKGGEGLSAERKEEQKSIDAAIIASVKKTEHLAKYLKASFGLSKGDRPHALKF